MSFGGPLPLHRAELSERVLGSCVLKSRGLVGARFSALELASGGDFRHWPGDDETAFLVCST